ncbi:uncharacterized transmembrane protein DDB_G0289901-like [Mercenaria mercenaria]|uniref:uncharacterized transmembrane protein DDB_G0289901-like n=1 Tax=Mercenaria mercenaria TaxID=6596 RepID=UPI00234FA497|nr:uncharacterized transmembrane protein DDB_G0289901-like [Mercenaria mercenaria]XP_045209972.2 uncharacterized transmembrane protein DDB_G0289901-like [Mercenaria mercenaria]XP_045209973.2 uncharacterized transmembrane protein DDB_G0289901-like [Mercenaria mercenaria]
MTLLKNSVLSFTLIWISLCTSKTFKIDYANGGNTGGMAASGPFVGDSGGSGRGLGGELPNGGGGGNGNGMGVNPFASISKGKGGSPFASAAGTGDGNGSVGMGAGSFLGGMNNAGGSGGSLSGGGGSGSSAAGMGAGPFTSGPSGKGSSNGVSPFASAMGNGGGDKGSGVGPFAGAVSGKGSSPFNANMDTSGGMTGVDFSSLMNSGPGGLSGGAFIPSNASHLMGHDFSKDLGNYDGQFGEMNLGQGQGENTVGVDNSRFDTTAYQQMLQQLFSAGNSGQELKDMGTPFDGSSYTSNYNTDSGEHHNTAMEASVGSFASADISSYAGSSNTATGQAISQFQGMQKGNAGHYTGSGSGSYSGGPNVASSGSNNDGTYSSPFDVNNYDVGHMSPSSGGAAGMGSGSDMNKGQNPFEINNYSTGKNMFSLNSNYNDAGSTSGNGIGTEPGPFDTSKFGMLGQNLNKQPGSGQNPFDTNKYQDSSALSNMMGNQKYQNIGKGSADFNQGLDEYGNVNFGTLSGLSGNTVDPGAAGGLGMTGTGSYSAGPKGSSSYNGLQDESGNGQYRAEYTGIGSTYSGAGTGYDAESKSQYETPFEADNYNDLLGNPFRSDSYFDTTKQNFKLPYETNGNLQQSSYSNSGPSAGYSGNRYVGSGPAGDPFHQGGNSMSGSNTMRGRRSVQRQPN